MSELEPVVRLSDATIFYPGGAQNPILRNVNLDVYRGQVAYLVGRVGSGKSSLLRTLYGELPLVVGAGRVCGINLRALPTAKIPILRRRLGVVFQEHSLITDFTVYQNLEFVLRATGWDQSLARKGLNRNNKQHAIDRHITDVLEMVDLRSKAHCYPLQISGGQRQRACIARALLNSPRLIIADEPTGNLDPASSCDVMTLLNDIAARGECGIILSTHNIENIRRFPNRTLLCEDGTIRDVIIE